MSHGQATFAHDIDGGRPIVVPGRTNGDVESTQTSHSSGNHELARDDVSPTDLWTCRVHDLAGLSYYDDDIRWLTAGHRVDDRNHHRGLR
jgi:hypothetical protein